MLKLLFTTLVSVKATTTCECVGTDKVDLNTKLDDIGDSTMGQECGYHADPVCADDGDPWYETAHCYTSWCFVKDENACTSAVFAYDPFNGELALADLKVTYKDCGDAASTQRDDDADDLAQCDSDLADALSDLAAAELAAEEAEASDDDDDDDEEHASVTVYASAALLAACSMATLTL